MQSPLRGGMVAAPRPQSAVPGLIPKRIGPLTSTNSKMANRAYRQIDAKAARAEVEKEQRDMRKKTARLRELRLAKEMEDRVAEEAQKSAKRA